METNRFNQIDDYLQDRLTHKEARTFEEEMATNNELKIQVKLCRELKEAILEEDVVNLRRKLEKISKENHQTKGLFTHISVKIAASVAVFVVATILLWASYSNPEYLFENYYSRYETPGTTRGSSANNDPTKIMELYGQGQLKKTIPLLETYTQTHTNDAVALLMLSSAYLENDMALKAEEIVKIMINQNQDAIYTETAQWYLCLAYLSQEKYKEAFIESSKIEAQGGKYAESAKKINKRLIKHLE